MIQGKYALFSLITSSDVLSRILENSVREQYTKIRHNFPQILDLIRGLSQPNVTILGDRLTDFCITPYIRGVIRT